MNNQNKRPVLQSRLSFVWTNDFRGSKEKTKIRRTKIVCTIGPVSSTVEQLEGLLDAGMNVARLNFSHGDHKSHAQTIKNIRQAAEKKKKICAILLDTKGPEIRTGKLKGGKPIKLEQGQELLIRCEKDSKFEGDTKEIVLDYENLPKVVKKDSIIKIDDGLIVCKVLELQDKLVKVQLCNSAELGQNKGVNLPDTEVDLPSITDKDKGDLMFGVEQKVDFIAASFTRQAEDVVNIRKVLGEKGKYIKIICKIENRQGLDNFDEILEVADGIMVARGDLGVEIPIQQVCSAQKMMIRKCNLKAKPVITATQMLESMVSNPRPTRAEATDVANAVFDGTDCVMLSGETAKGAYPKEAVIVMAKICLTAEQALDHESVFLNRTSTLFDSDSKMTVTEATTSSAVKCAMALEAQMIVAITESGNSARYTAKYNSKCPVVVVTSEPYVARQCLITAGLEPMVAKTDKPENLYGVAIVYAKVNKLVHGAGKVVLVYSQIETGVTDTMVIRSIK